MNIQPQGKTTAHQLWCDELNRILSGLLMPPNASKNIITTTKLEARKKAEKAVSIAIDFENTRLRVIVDEIIKNLDEAKKEVDSVKPRWFQIRKKIDWSKKKGYLEGLQKAVLLVVNTPPKTSTEPTHTIVNGPMKGTPVMKVAK